MQITTAALIKRINRKLKEDYRMLRTLRGDRWLRDLGRYYVVDMEINAIVLKDVDPVELAKELGVLQDWERAAEAA